MTGYPVKGARITVAALGMVAALRAPEWRPTGPVLCLVKESGLLPCLIPKSECTRHRGYREWGR